VNIHKVTQDILGAFKDSHWHLPLFAGLFSIIRNRHSDLEDGLSDLGDLGDNVPVTLIKSLSSRRGL